MVITSERLEQVINHFRAYHYGEPFEGQPVTGPHSFDLSREDGETILHELEAALTIQKLREVDQI